jgi:shikimate kinase
MNKRNVFLVGFMGTGKTTIGKELAKMMGRKFLDLDAELERRLGKTVGDYFSEHGEVKFREVEERVAIELSTTNNRVIATGGGTILNPRVYEALHASGLLVCLYTKRDDLVDRLKRNDKRPLVRGQSPEEIRERVEQLLRERSEKYDRVKIRIDTSDLTPMAAARKIFELVSLQTRILQGFETSIDLS